MHRATGSLFNFIAYNNGLESVVTKCAVPPEL